MRSLAIVGVAAALLFGAKEVVSVPAAEARMPQNWKLWVKMGRCEQPGKGAFGVYWSHKGPTYQGGLGFYYATWQHWKLPWYPSNAGYATWRQQMWVANRIYNRYGGSHPWGCG